MNVRTMTVDDIPFAMRLKTQNGWNQLEADWRRQLALEPTGSFVAELDGRAVGTACACVFGDIAWVNFVLVDKAQRGQGTGSALMRHVIDWLDARNVRTIRLDATPLGQPVYAKLGFVGDFTLSRFEGLLPSPSERLAGGEGDLASNISLLLPSDLAAMFVLDEAITKTRREKLLCHIHEANPDLSHKYTRAGRFEGYCLCRPGSNAWQLGPLQGMPDAALYLLADAAQRLAGQRVYLDVPLENVPACVSAQALGLTAQRTFLRMTRGRRIAEDVRLFWTGSGPEKG